MSSLKAPNQVGTSTTTQNVPSYVSSAQQALLGAAGNITAPFLANQPQFAVAGFTPDQETAFNLARSQAQSAFSAPAAGHVGDYGAIKTPDVGTTAAYIPGAQITAQGIQDFLNPFQSDVAATTAQQLQEANDKQINAIRARAGAEGAYGGNREALQESEQNRNFGNTLASTLAGLNYGGYNSAAGLAGQNAGLLQGAQQANQQAANQASTLASELAQQEGMFNAQQSLAGSAMQNNLANADWQRQMQALQALLGVGNQEQGLAQTALDVPFKMLGTLGGVTPGNYGSSTSQPIYGPTTASTIGSLGMLGLGLAQMSDKTMKKDMEKVGKHPSGVDIYKYRFKGAPPDSPKMMGPMAQDMEKKFPGSTMRIGGKMAIKGSALAMLGM